MRVVTACAASLAAFFVKHGRLFEREAFEPVCESYFDENDLEVRFTAPYEAGRPFRANNPRPTRPPEPTRAKVGRNEPCPCGSGRKYKKCCLGKEDPLKAALNEPASVHEMDQGLVEEMVRFSGQRIGETLHGAARDFRDPEAAIQLLVPWSVYHYLIDGKPVAQRFVEDRSAFLSERELGWLEAQRASWLSVWEVTGVVPGVSLSLRDLLSGEERTVQEAGGSKSLVHRDVILGRVVDPVGFSVLCGIHPRSLPPREAAEVVQRIRGKLRRKSAVPVHRLRDEKLGRSMIALWEEAVQQFDERRSIPPRLHNTDGDELLLTVDHFDFEPTDLSEVESCLSSIDGIEPSEPDGSGRSYAVLRPGNPMHAGLENTLVGRIAVFHGTLRVETNSVKRADSLRANLENACGRRVRHRLREHSDPSALLQHGNARRASPEPRPDLTPQEARSLLRAVKEKHYAGWPDTPLPALEGKTPREAVRTKSGKNKVALLLKDLENHEARLPEEERFDFSCMRKKLALDE